MVSCFRHRSRRLLQHTFILWQRLQGIETKPSFEHLAKFSTSCFLLDKNHVTSRIVINKQAEKFLEDLDQEKVKRKKEIEFYYELLKNEKNEVNQYLKYFVIVI